MVARPGDREADLCALPRSPGPYKRIRRLEFAELPKTVSGKIRRIELRERTAQGDGGAEYREENYR